MVTTIEQLDATRWTLDPSGNQTAVDYYTSYFSNSFNWLNWFQNTANTVNEHTTRKSKSGAEGRLYDYFYADTTANWTCPGSGDAFTIDTTAHTLTVTAVARGWNDWITAARFAFECEAYRAGNARLRQAYTQAKCDKCPPPLTREPAWANSPAKYKEFLNWEECCIGINAGLTSSQGFIDEFCKGAQTQPAPECPF